MSVIPSLRLEVEVDQTGLVNLIENPRGDLGGWGWVTPAQGSTLVGENTPATLNRVGLRYSTAKDVTSNYFLSEAFRVTAGYYVAARWHLNTTPKGVYRVRFDWLDTNLDPLGVSTWTSFDSAAIDIDQAKAPVVAPVGTVYAAIRFEVGDRTGGGAPSYPYVRQGAAMSITDVAVAAAVAAAELSIGGEARTNFATNPTFGVDLSGWESNPIFGARAPAAMVRNAAQQLEVTWPTTSGESWVNTFIYLEPGETYTASALLRVPTGSPSPRMEAVFLGIGAPVTTRDAWTRASVTFKVPADSGGLCFIGPLVAGPVAGQRLDVDDLMIEKGTEARGYFDGSTPAGDGYSRSWTGTPHASASVQTSSALPPITSAAYADILGPTHQITIDREDLNVGVLTATILDAALDPAVASVLRPGRRFRATVSEGSLFNGRISAADVTYDLKARRVSDPKHARIALTAIDSVSPLANSSRPDGVKTIADLPAVLEGCGVPWVCDGNSGQVNASAITRNESATAIDQVAITRDSQHGQAWVDREGVLQAWTNLASYGDQLILNPGFENEGEEWKYADATGTFSTEQHATGARSLRLVAGVGVDSARAFQFVPVTPIVTYQVETAVRAASNERAVSLHLLWFDALGGSLGSSADDFDAATQQSFVGSWSPVVRTVTAPAGAVYAAVTLAVLTPGDGEIHYVDSVSCRAVGAIPILDEADYSEVDVSFSTDRLINEVRITLLRVNLATGETVEVPYGPFIDQASVDEWNTRRSAEFTIQGLPDDPVPMAAFAQSVFDANATPRVRVNEVTLPIRSEADLTVSKALADLYMLLEVRNDDKGLAERGRVTKVSHDINPKRWMTRLGFSDPDSVASPQVTPKVQSLPTGDTDTSWHVSQTTSVVKTTSSKSALPDLEVTVTPSGPSTVYLVTIDADVLISSAGTVNVIVLYVDGIEVVTPQLVTGGPAGMRVAGAKTWRVTDLEAGPHVLTAKTYNFSGTGATVYHTHTTMTVAAVAEK